MTFPLPSDAHGFPASGVGGQHVISPGERKIRILVVDDSFFMRQVIARMLQEETEFTVVGSARDGLEAVDKNKSLEPDVVTLDVEMPGLDGLGALDQMLRTRPVAVVMLSAHTGEGMGMALLALERGAVDCVGKPAGSVSFDLRKIQDELIEKIRAAARVPAILLRPRPDLPSPQAFSRKSPVQIPTSTTPAHFAVAVASSTGGPRALHELMARMTQNPKACFMFVQHMATGFTAALAKRLNDTCPFPIKEAEDGERLMQGIGYVAPGGRHLVAVKGPSGFFAGFYEGPPRHGVKPSADYLLTSVSQTFGRSSIGVVLTGMGRDGSKGLLDMRQAGAHTYAQDESSCVVFGMPKAAIECGAAWEVLPLNQLGDSLKERLKKLDS
jgi:two-component system chemotaxis response regulator CheB